MTVYDIFLFGIKQVCSFLSLLVQQVAPAVAENQLLDCKKIIEKKFPPFLFPHKI